MPSPCYHGPAPSLVPAVHPPRKPVANARRRSLATTPLLGYHIWLVFVKRQSVGMAANCARPPRPGNNGPQKKHEVRKDKVQLTTDNWQLFLRREVHAAQELLKARVGAQAEITSPRPGSRFRMARSSLVTCHWSLLLRCFPLQGVDFLHAGVAQD